MQKQIDQYGILVCFFPLQNDLAVNSVCNVLSTFNLRFYFSIKSRKSIQGVPEFAHHVDFHETKVMETSNLACGMLLFKKILKSFKKLLLS